MREKTNSLIGKSAEVLLGYLTSGKTTFLSSELQEDLGVTNEQTYKLCYQLKEKNLIILISRNGEHPKYTLAYTENPILNVAPQRPEIEYSKAFMDKLEELGASTRSSKDRRIATMLTAFLPIGKITFQDYKKAQYESSWQKDMSLAEQIGLVQKSNPGCYTILQDIRPGLPELKRTQKEVASLIYKEFGDAAFSSEMVIASLDYTKAHTCAILHQFTLLRILDCNTDSPDKFTYQFRVNPRENPECFTDVA